MICFTSAAHLPLVLSCLLNPSTLTADFEHVIVPVICFLVICFLPCLLTRYWFVSCQQHVSSVLSPFLLRCVVYLWTGCCSSFIAAGTVCYLDIDLFTVSSTCTSGLSCSIILVQWLLVWQVTVSIRLFFTWVPCIYIILDKVCNILYVFSLNSTVCSLILGVHLSSDQVTYDCMMDADLYNSFSLRLPIKSF